MVKKPMSFFILNTQREENYNYAVESKRAVSKFFEVVLLLLKYKIHKMFYVIDFISQIS